MPQYCHDLYGMPDVANSAASVNRVSDYLGALSQKGKVVRSPAPKNRANRTRWIYEWSGDKGPALRGIEYRPRVLADRPTVLITEEGNVITVELPNLIISICQQPAPSGKYHTDQRRQSMRRKRTLDCVQHRNRSALSCSGVQFVSTKVDPGFRIAV